MLKTLSAAFFALGIGIVASAAPVAPDLQGLDLRTGQSFRAESPGVKGTVVVFLSSKCPCSRSHEPVLSRLAAEFPEFRFVGVHSNADEPTSDARTHFEKSGLSFPVLQDDGTRIADHFGATKTPHAFVIDTAGKQRYRGGVDDSHSAEAARTHYLKLALSALQAGREPERTEARTLGCAIRR